MAKDDRKKILVIEDSEPIRTSVAAMLAAENYVPFEAENGRAGVEAARRELPDLILCDVQMPKLDGYGVLSALREDSKTASIPFIFLTGRSERDQIREGMDLGADDYLTKPFSRVELMRAINARLARRAVIGDHYAAEIRLAEQKLHQLMQYDALTGLPNRMLLREKLQQLISSSADKSIAVMLLGLDRFKRINDSLGYSFGDILIKFAAERLTAHSAGNHIVARLGGDRFAILISASARSSHEPVLQSILDTISRPFVLESHQVFLNASGGVAFYPDHGNDIDVLIKNAEIAMLHAKRTGGNNFQTYAVNLNALESRRLDLESGLRHAMDNSEFDIYYQPQINLSSGRIVGAEALIRWKHPEYGFISPGEFIPIIEDNGWIIPIGDWIMTTACRQTTQWHASGFKDLRIGINLSSRQFSQKNLAERLDEILAETGLSPEYLEIELTESSIVRDADAAAETLNALKQRGIQIAMDDFGTGYSTLTYLRQFPFDRVKIDQSFIRDVTMDSKNAAITTAVIQMAHNLELKVVAEGVESYSELFFLYLHQCEEIQGYIYSPPVPAEEFGKLIASGRSLQIQRQ